jgi:hypothetical protein
MSIPKLTDKKRRRNKRDSEGCCGRSPNALELPWWAGPDLEEEEGEVDVEVGEDARGLGP